MEIIKKDGIYGAPELVIEIFSPSTAHYDLKENSGFMKGQALRNTG